MGPKWSWLWKNQVSRTQNKRDLQRKPCVTRKGDPGFVLLTLHWVRACVPKLAAESKAKQNTSFSIRRRRLRRSEEEGQHYVVTNVQERARTELPSLGTSRVLGSGPGPGWTLAL